MLLILFNGQCVFIAIFVSDLECRIPEENAPVHVINVDIQDNHEEATIGAFLITELAMLVCLQIIQNFVCIIRQISHIAIANTQQRIGQWYTPFSVAI